MKPIHKKAVVDIVIPTSGRYDLLRKCLASIIREASCPLSVTIVDDGSNLQEHEENADVLNKDNYKHPNLVDWKVLRHNTPEGFPKSCNDGAKQGRGKYILFLNDDVELAEDYFIHLLGVFGKSEMLGICGTKLYFPSYSSASSRPAGKLQHTGLALDIKATVVHPLVGWSADNPKTQVSREVWAVTGAAMTVRRDLFQRVGGFDPIYGLGTFEDADLCLKVRKLGYTIWMDDSVRGTHYTGATVERKQIQYPLQQNAMIFKSKWANSNLLVFDLWTWG